MVLVLPACGGLAGPSVKPGPGWSWPSAAAGGGWPREPLQQVSPVEGMRTEAWLAFEGHSDWPEAPQVHGLLVPAGGTRSPGAHTVPLSVPWI